MASSIIEKLFCKDVPNIPIIAIGNSPKIYLVHAHMVVSLLIDKPSRNTSRIALDNLLKSDAGKHIKQDGDLIDAYHRGPIVAMIYTHRLKSGYPSRFVTLDGLKEIITHLPNQDESAKARYHSLFNEYFTHLRAPTAFEVATQEQCFQDIEDDDVMPEIQTEGVRGSMHNNDNASVVTTRMYIDCLTNHNETERRLFQEKFDMAMKNAALEKDKAILEMQLKMQAENAALQKELDLERLRREYDAKLLAAQRTPPPNDARKKRAKKTDIRDEGAIDSPPAQTNTTASVSLMNLPSAAVLLASRPIVAQPTTLFPKLRCVAYSNYDPGVNHFVPIPDDGSRDERLQYGHRPQNVSLVVRPAGDPAQEEEGEIGHNDNKYHAFAFAYKGDRLTRQQLRDARVIREAYGVERHGLHFLCLVLSRTQGRRILSISGLPYKLKLIPSSVVPERIDAQHPGDGWRHFSVLKTTILTDDPVLTALKAPCGSKWSWFSWREAP